MWIPPSLPHSVDNSVDNAAAATTMTRLAVDNSSRDRCTNSPPVSRQCPATSRTTKLSTWQIHPKFAALHPCTVRTTDSPALSRYSNSTRCRAVKRNKMQPWCCRRHSHCRSSKFHYRSSRPPSILVGPQCSTESPTVSAIPLPSSNRDSTGVPNTNRSIRRNHHRTGWRARRDAGP